MPAIEDRIKILTGLIYYTSPDTRRRYQAELLAYCQVQEGLPASYNELDLSEQERHWFDQAYEEAKLIQEEAHMSATVVRLLIVGAFFVGVCVLGVVLVYGRLHGWWS